MNLTLDKALISLILLLDKFIFSKLLNGILQNESIFSIKLFPKLNINKCLKGSSFIGSISSIEFEFKFKLIY